MYRCVPRAFTTVGRVACSRRSVRALSTDPRPKLRLLQSTSNDACFNLATEEYIFRQMQPDSHVLFLWRNGPTVVLGKHQNAWAECDTKAMERDGVQLVRRPSGGGAVFQDLGNTCWTFMSPRAQYDKERNTEIVVDALGRVGVAAQASGRNDILVDGKKVSGSAFKLANDRAFHHGTLLINVNMGALGKYLTPNQKKLESKGVKSVAARVANLVDINPAATHERLVDALAQAFASRYGYPTPPEMEILQEGKLHDLPAIKQYYEELRAWEWRFGHSPEFSHSLPVQRFDWGTLDVRVDVREGRVQAARVFSDALNTDLVEALQASLVGVPFDGTQLQRAVLTSAATQGVRAAGPDTAAMVQDFAGWVASL